MAERPSPTKRPRAPTITIDDSPTAGQPSQGHYRFITMSPTRHANRFKDSEITSPTSDNPNALSVPTLRSRGDSVNSQASQSTIGTAGSNTLAGSQHSEHGQQSRQESLAIPSDQSQTQSAATIKDEDVFKPDADAEASTFDVENNPFGITPGHLAKLIPRKNIQALALLHGSEGLAKLLRTDLSQGLDFNEDKLNGKVNFKDIDDIPADTSPTDERIKDISKSDTAITTTTTNNSSSGGFSDRKRVFGANRLPPKRSKSFFQLVWLALQDKILILLTVAAVVSLAIGIWQSITKKPGQGAKIDWVEGVAILAAVTIVVLVGAVVDYSKEKQFIKLNSQKEDRVVKVNRSGKTRLVSVYDIFPGDVINLEPGDMIPVDGIYIQGSGITCDESSATGESDLIRKTAASDVMKAYQEGRNTAKMDPFILAGAQVNEGVGTFLCTAVGIHSSFGKTMMSLQDSNPPTPLQERLDKLAG
jgi:Ca2+-transporting ATPase